jgi:hypothetical protein
MGGMIAGKHHSGSKKVLAEIGAVAYIFRPGGPDGFSIVRRFDLEWEEPGEAIGGKRRDDFRGFNATDALSSKTD